MQQSEENYFPMWEQKTSDVHFKQNDGIFGRNNVPPKSEIFRTFCEKLQSRFLTFARVKNSEPAVC